MTSLLGKQAVVRRRDGRPSRRWRRSVPAWTVHPLSFPADVSDALSLRFFPTVMAYAGALFVSLRTVNRKRSSRSVRSMALSISGVAPLEPWRSRRATLIEPHRPANDMIRIDVPGRLDQLHH